MAVHTGGEENSFDHLKDADQQNNIYMGSGIFYFFFEMAESYILGIYVQQHDEAELERPNSVGSGNPSSFPSLSLCPLSGALRWDRLFTRGINAEHHPEQGSAP